MAVPCYIKISEELGKKPGYSNLSFVILRPADLHDQFRPGYVPCPIAGDFKFRDGRLNLSVMFRTNDAFSVGYADIYYLRCLQLEILDMAQSYTNKKNLMEGKIGDLSLYFSRTYVEKSKKLNRNDETLFKSVKVVPLAKKLLEFIETQHYAGRLPASI